MAQLKVVRWLAVFSLLLGLALPSSAHSAQTAAQTAASGSDKPATAKEVAPLRELGNIGSNQIPLLNNRFRIDFAVEEITIVFFRKKGSPSVVLVKPDGSKVYARTAKEQNMQWFDDKTYDLIKIKNPTPGPWQAVGDILPESRIMVLTDIDLQVDPLPKDMMLGEHLKVTARLTNGGKPINARDFRDILQLDVLLISTQKPEYDNANSTVIEFTKFLDDGKNFDERPRDAIFTGEFNLTMQAGEWVPKYIVTTPLYTRELLQDPIVVVRTPIETSYVEAKTEDDKHLVTYKVTEGPFDPDSLMVQGRLRFPSGEVQSFTLNETKGDSRVLEVVNAGTGTYRIEQMIYGKTKSGREVVIALPEYTFAAIGPKVEVPKDAVKPKASADAAAAGAEGGSTDAAAAGNAAAGGTVVGEAADAAASNSPAAEPPAEFPWGTVIAVNMIILLVGGVVVVVSLFPDTAASLRMVAAKLNPAGLLKKRKTDDAAAVGGAENAAANSDAVAKKSAKNQASDDILDLSLPDD